MAVELSPKFEEAVAAFRRAQTDEDRVASLQAIRAEVDESLRSGEAANAQAVSPIYQAAWDQFQYELPELLKEKRGWSVMYRGKERLGIAKDDRDLYRLSDRQGIPREEIIVYFVEPIPEYDMIGCGAWSFDAGPVR